MSFWLHGTDGTISLDLNAADEMLRFRGGQRGGSLEPIVVPENEASAWRVEEEFIGAIRGSEELKLTTFEDGVKYMAFTDAVNESLETGREVMVDYSSI